VDRGLSLHKPLDNLVCTAGVASGVCDHEAWIACIEHKCLVSDPQRVEAGVLAGGHRPAFLLNHRAEQLEHTCLRVGIMMMDVEEVRLNATYPQMVLAHLCPACTGTHHYIMDV